jgi:hypothetical protein
MFRNIHIASLHWIVVDVIELLPHYVFAVNQLCMCAFLPNLVCTVCLMCALGKLQALERTFGMGLFKMVDDVSRCEGFKTSYGFRQI